jgi:cell division protease FtsH
VSATDVSSSDDASGIPSKNVDMKLEVVVIPVSDVDRAKEFYGRIGWRLDADIAAGDVLRIIQYTPPGSGCSVAFGTNVTTAAPGSVQDLYLIVSDIEATRDSLVASGVEVGEVFHEVKPGARFHHAEPSGRAGGRSPNGSYWTFATFSDPDGNGWLLQEVTTRLPGRSTLPRRRTHPRAIWHRRSAARRPPTASMSSVWGRATRTGPTGTPLTWSRRRPARSCRRDGRRRRSRRRPCREGGSPSPGYRLSMSADPSPRQPPTQGDAPRDARLPKPAPRRFRFGWWIAWLIVLLGLNYWIASRATEGPARIRVPYSPFFLDQVEKKNVVSITSKGTAIQGMFEKATSYEGSKSSTRFKTEVPAFANTDQLSALLERKAVVVNAKPLTGSIPWWQNLLLSFGPTILLVALIIWATRRAGGMQNLLGQFGRSRARLYEADSGRVTFADVAGIDEAKQELSEVVDFLRDQEKYRRVGARIPHGVLLSGPPGTGKTLLARAVAGEANVPFFSLAASEFVEAIVGIGASRVRDLFANAKAAAPAIIFIDELDAIGRSRTSGVAGFSGGNDEREQTLNQILTEMDGFTSSTGVIVIAATNRPDVLDQALLRPGRFDRRVAVQPPDRNGREAILRVHTRSVPVAADVDLGAIAASTPGMVGADLANLVNEAALLAARRGHDQVHRSDFTDALERIVLGAERKVMITPADRRRTAYHEGGHAIVGMLTEGADPVRKISIIPRGLALGVTFAAPDADRFNYTEQELRAKIKVALGGRAAEELVFGDVTTGAESDIQQLTQIARQMVGRWGMSRTIGTVAVLPSDGQGPLLPGVSEVSPETQELVDAEVRALVGAAHEEVVALLREHREQLDSLAAALLEHETLDQADAYTAAGIAPAERAAEPVASA